MSRTSLARTRLAVFGLSFVALIVPALALANDSQYYTSPGTYTFTVPAYTSMTVRVWGGGGGGEGGYGGLTGQGGGGGGYVTGSFSANSLPASVTVVVGNGGSGGVGGYPVNWASPSEVPANNGGESYFGSYLWAQGGTAGAYDGQAPGGSYGGGGGENGGVGGGGAFNGYPTGSCSYDPNYGEAYACYGGSTSCAGAGGGGGGYPSDPGGGGGSSGCGGRGGNGGTQDGESGYAGAAATITASSTSIQVGQSTNILATYSAGSGDALTCTDISYYPSGASGLVGSCTPFNKTYQFVSTSTGTVNFYAAAKTDYYTTWNTYTRNLTVTVTNPPPTATLSVSPASITEGSKATLTWSSTNATSCTGSNFSTGGATSGSVLVSPTQSTTYTGSCTGPGGTTNFSGSATVTVSCTESWSCSGNTIVQTNTDCSTTNLSTCTSPQFCQAGSNICLAPVISFNPSGNDTGHLQLIPNIVKPGATTQVNWNVSDAQSCTVQGSNGDDWSGLSGDQTSKAINSQVTYTLFCNAYGTNPDLTETQTIDVSPVFKEL